MNIMTYREKSGKEKKVPAEVPRRTLWKFLLLTFLF